MTKKKRLSGFDFTGENAAVALVSELEGQAANGYSTLVMKSTDVVVELSMAEYLSKFFGLWSYDAGIVSKLLGYSDDYELWDEDKISEKTTILKSMKYQSEYSQEDMKKVADIVKSMAAASNFKITDLDEIVKAADGEDPVSNKDEDVIKSSNNTSPTEEVNMSDKDLETIEKSKYEADIAKAVAAKEAELVEIQKGLEAELTEFKKAKAEAEKAEFIQKAKGFETAGVTEDKVEVMAVALQKASKDAELAILVDSLNTLTELTKSLNGEQEQGHSADLAETANTPADVMMELLKARKAEQSK